MLDWFLVSKTFCFETLLRVVLINTRKNIRICTFSFLRKYESPEIWFKRIRQIRGIIINYTGFRNCFKKWEKFRSMLFHVCLARSARKEKLLHTWRAIAGKMQMGGEKRFDLIVIWTYNSRYRRNNIVDFSIKIISV